MRKSDKKDYLTILILASLMAMFTMLLLPLIARAETILSYKACSESKCVDDTIYAEDGLLHVCVMQGQTIVLKDLERKARAGFIVKKWRCTTGKRNVEL